MEHTRMRAREHHDLAVAALAGLPPGPALDALQQLTRLSIERDH